MEKQGTATKAKAAASSRKGRVSIRYAKPEEMRQVWAVDRDNLRENWDIHPLSGRPLREAELIREHRKLLAQWYRQEKHKVLVAVIEGSIVGVAWYGVDEDLFFPETIGFLYSLVVAPDYRQMGIGKRLMNEFKRRSQKAGARFLRLNVLQKNDNAMNLYRQAGFFMESHVMLARLEPTGPEKAKQQAAQRKGKEK